MSMNKKRLATIEAPYLDMLREYRRNEKKIKQEQTEVDQKPYNDADPREQHEPDPNTTIRPALSLETDSESDIGFEDVNIDNSESSDIENVEELTDINISLDSAKARHLTRTKQRTLRKPQRLILHKLGLMAWMSHAQLRNKWLCRPELLNSEIFRNLLPESVLLEIHPPNHLTTFLKSKKLVDGLEHAMEIWRAKFSVIRSGLASSGKEFGDVVNSFEDFKNILLESRGSTDMSGQGYVASVRSLNLEARLVCSLQPPDNLQADTSISSSQSNSKQESNCPIYWAEIWDPHATRWIVVDPLTGTIRSPTRSKVKLKIEPPLNDRLNIMRYCIGFDSEGYARDVTRRYADAYNARTRKKRLPYVESEEWLDRLFGIFSKTKFSQADRDELVESSRYPRLEGIPTRVQDFVGHPEYVLADQVHKNEVLRPGAKACGVLAQKPSKNKSATPPSYIYKRSDVLIARSSQSWYKQGREIAIGAQPRARREMKNRLTGETESIALYTYDQTVLYRPPPVNDDGTVPKSIYRTIDVFAANMIPRGATHIKDKLAPQAAKLLRLDYANAVINVEYGKRGAHSNMSGIVVADPYVDAVNAVIDGLRQNEQEHANKLNTIRILKLWRQFIMGIQIWERVESMNPTSEYTNDEPERSEGVPSEETSSERASSSIEIEDVDDETRPRLRNFRALLRKNVPTRRKKRSVKTVDLARVQADLMRYKADKTQVASNNMSQQNGTSYAALEAISPNDSFDDLDVDEISESEL